MDENNISNAIKDGDTKRPPANKAPPIGDIMKQSILEGTVKKKRRRGKSKRKILKPFVKAPWPERRQSDKSKRNNRYRKIVLAKTHAPFNNNQFLMEIHKPEPQNAFHMQTPSARTRDSSFSIDSEDNYFFSLPEDEEEYLTKEFSSVYEDAQSERLSNMSKNELIQEYLLLEAKYENLVKRTERSKPNKFIDDDKNMTDDKDMMLADKESMITDRDTSGTSIASSAADESTCSDVLQRIKEQDEQIRDLQLSNEKLRLENEHLRERQHESSSADSESDSSSSSESDSSSSRSVCVVDEPVAEVSEAPNENHIHLNGQSVETEDSEPLHSMVNGHHNPND